MITIVFDHPADGFPDLKIAGEFTDWKGVPMKINADSGKWEYGLDESSLAKHEDKNKVHFKFIDQNGNWFADDEYPKEIDEHSNENNVATLEDNKDEGSAKEVKDEVDESTNEDTNNEQELYDEGPGTPTPSLKGDKTTTYFNLDNLQHTLVTESVTKGKIREVVSLDEAPAKENSRAENKESSSILSQQEERNKSDEQVDNNSEGNDNTRVNEDTYATDSLESEHEIANTDTENTDTENTDIFEQEEIQKNNNPVQKNTTTMVREGDANAGDYESVLKKLLGALGRFFGSWFSWLTTKMSDTETT
ncbi:uip4p [Saccharomyces arboricola H-6]|uniref:Uip4p n=1 Tax=Saccharomyces arboricola (strain H-6 / AS 2.3317 / CBS 10644) TaxID=1160507 RepID=J8Q1E8_SACAR|nr:uip4p [Saccharomyces arboricola H-6]